MVAPATRAPIAKPIHIRAPDIPEKDIDVLKTPEHSRAFKIGVAVALILLALTLCVGAFLGWRYLTAEKSPPANPPPQSPVPAAPVTPPPAKVAPAATVDPAPPPEQPPVDEEGPLKIDLDHSPVAPVPPAKGNPQTTTSSPVRTTVAPGVTANMGVSIPNSGASPEFRAFVANAKITGVFQGSSARAFINGRLTRVGEIVDPKLGIIFDSVDAERKQIVFKDGSGAVATRKY